MKKVPSDGGKKAFYVLKLFEAIVESEVVYGQTKQESTIEFSNSENWR